MDQSRDSLPPGTVVDCYLIRKLIGRGGFSLIYLATDEDTGESVVIKEYLPKNLAERDAHSLRINARSDDQIDTLHHGRKLFFQEIKALAALSHPNIVNVRNFFLSHNTGYLVMDYHKGKNLGSYIKQHKGGLSATFILTVVPPVLDALRLIHSRSLLHLDIKPGNIHVRAGGNPLLLDFGAVHRFATTRRFAAGHVVTPGFSPIEQYDHAGYVGPWSDLYAIGASMRACMEGKPPPGAIERHAKDEMRPAAEAFRRRYPDFLLNAVDWAMEVDPTLRPQNAEALLDALNDGTEQTASGLNSQTDPTRDRSQEHNK
jgi:serine/threonine protein kinase